MQKIYDTHLHIWNTKKLHLPWLESVPALNRDFTLEQYQHAAQQYHITQLNYVEVNVDKTQLEQEANLILAQAESSKQISSIVLGADLTRIDFADYINQFAHHSNIVGIRHGGFDFDDANIYLSETFVNNVRLLASLDLHCEVLPRISHMASVEKLISLCPDTRFIIDHCGFISARETDQTLKQSWQQGMQRYAQHDNTYCKISGLLENIGTRDWTADDLAPIVELCCDLFGEDRILFGSNWPVCNLHGSLSRWIDALQHIVRNHSDAFKNKLFYQNATRLLLGK